MPFKIMKPEYWEMVAEERSKLIVKRTDILLEKTALAYKTALKEVNQEVKQFYRRYGTEIKSPVFKTLSDGTQVISGYSKKTVVTWVDAQKRLGNKAKRIDALNAQLDSIIKDLYGNISVGLVDTIQSDYPDLYHRTVFETFNGVGIGQPFQLIPTEQIKRAITSPWSGATFSERLWKNRELLQFNVNSIMTQGIIQGKSIDIMARELANKMNSDFKTARRLIQTEMNFSMNDATFEGYKASGFVEEYVYLALLDGRTSSICRNLDGENFDLNERSVGINYPPTHPNCRSTTRSFLPDTNANRVRLAKSTNGKYYEMGDLEYQEWKNKYIDGKEPIPKQKSIPVVNNEGETVNLDFS